MTTFETIFSPIKEEMTRIESELVKNLDLDVPLLKEVLEYILSTSGKRLRPAIHFLTARCFGYERETMYLIASLTEYIHTATILHDDVIDNAEFRRTKQTPRTIWGNEAAVLVGDFLFTESFRQISQLNDTRLIRMMSEATTKMAKGEIIQLMCPFDRASEDEYLKIVEYKTSVLIALSAKMGAYLCQTSEENILRMNEFGINFGNAFQIIDDLIDYTSEFEDSGKKKGVDLKERKITLPLCHLINTANNKDQNKVKAVLNKDLITDDDFDTIRSMMTAYGSIEYTQKKATEYAAMAEHALSYLPQNKYSKSLKELTKFCITRNY